MEQYGINNIDGDGWGRKAPEVVRTSPFTKQFNTFKKGLLGGAGTLTVPTLYGLKELLPQILADEELSQKEREKYESVSKAFGTLPDRPWKTLEAQDFKPIFDALRAIEKEERENLH